MHVLVDALCTTSLQDALQACMLQIPKNPTTEQSCSTSEESSAHPAGRSVHLQTPSGKKGGQAGRVPEASWSRLAASMGDCGLPGPVSRCGWG